MSSSSTCTSTRGPQGPAGQSQYTYIAYASDNIGTGFSLVPSNNLKYLQVKVSSVPILNPTIANFTGTWVKYIGDNGANGTSGTNGKDGANGAISFSYKWSAVTNTANPGAGYVKVNDPDVSNANIVCISYEDDFGNTVQAALNLIGSSTSATKAVLVISQYGNAANYVVYDISSAPIAGGGAPGYYIISGANHVSSSSSAPFTANDDVVFSFSIVGDKGDEGSAVLFNDLSDVPSTGSGAWEQLMTYTVPSNTLDTNGSYLKITANFICGNPQVGATDVEMCALIINGNYITGLFAYQYERILIEAELHRINATDTKLILKRYYNGGGPTGTSIRWNTATYVGTIPSNSPIIIEASAQDTVAGPQAAYIVAQQLTVEKHIK